MPTESKPDVLRRVIVTLCEPCLLGEGGECHTPGCALWMSRGPDAGPIAHELLPPSFGPCNCRKLCGDINDEIGVCKSLPRPPEPPLVEIVTVYEPWRAK